VRPGHLGGVHNLLQLRLGTGEGDVLANRALEEEIVLQDDADPRAQMRGVDLLDVLVVDADDAGLRGIQLLQEPGDRGFARPTALRYSHISFHDRTD